MDFYIRQHSTLPILKHPTDVISKLYNITNDMWENCVVNFSMIDKKTGNYEIANVEAEIAQEIEIEGDRVVNYFLLYKFSKLDTKDAGDFFGEFKVEFINDYCGTLTIPTQKESINIFIQKSITKIG